MADAQVALLFGVAGGGKIGGASGQKIKDELTSIMKAIDNAGVLKVNVGVNIEGSAKKWRKNIQEVLNKATASEKFVIKLTRIDASSAIKDLQNKLKKVANSVSMQSGMSVSFKAGELDAVSSEVSKVGKNADESAEKLARVKAELKAISLESSNITSAYKRVTNGTKQGKYSEEDLAILKQKYIELQTATSLMNQNGASGTNEYISKVKSLQKEISDLIILMDAAGKKANIPEKISMTELEKTEDISKMNDLVSSIQKMRQSWTKAATGSTSSEYASLGRYEKELSSLRIKLDRAEISQEEFNNEFSRIKGNVKDASVAIRDAGENTKSFADRMSFLAKKFGSWLTISQIIMFTMRTMRQMIDVVVDLDSAMTELKKVTDETSYVYDKFLDNASDRAKKVGASVSDVVNATADFARLGYTLNEASELADVAIIYKNVADGIDNIQEASGSIISTMKAFGIETAESMGVVDKFNEIGNNFAISSEGVGEALRRSASAMASANNTLDETIALATAANTVVQNPEVVGTSLKTISMYLRAAKTEAEQAGEATDGMAESVSKLRDDLLSLTGGKVDIMSSSHEFKSTYQILKEISKVWNQISDVSQANILQKIGGKRNANVVAAILSNFTVAEEALETSANSAGSALQENEKVLESIQGRLMKFKSSFQTLSKDIIGSDTVKTVVSAGTSIIDLFDNIIKMIDKIGGMKTILGTALFFNIDKITNKFSKIKEYMSGMTLATGTFSKAFKESFSMAQIDGASKMRAAMTGLSAGINTVASSMSTLQIAIGSFMAVVAVVSTVMSIIDSHEAKIKEANDALIQRSKDSAKESENIYNLYVAYQSAKSATDKSIESKNELKNATEALSAALRDEQDAIDGVSGSYKEQTKEELHKAVLDAQDALRISGENILTAISPYQILKTQGFLHPEKAYDVLSSIPKYNEELLGDWKYPSEADDVIQLYEALIEARYDMIEAEETSGSRYEDINSLISMLKPSIEEYTDSEDRLTEATGRYNNVLTDNIELNEKLVNIAPEIEYAEPLDMTEFVSGIGDAIDSVESLASAMGKLGEGTALTNSEMLDLVQKFPELLSQANLFSDGTIEGQKKALEAVTGIYQAEYNAKIDSKIAELKATQKILEQQIDLEADKSIAIQEIEGITNEGIIGQESELVDAISSLNTLQGENFVSFKGEQLGVNEEALNAQLAQGLDYGEKSEKNIWEPYARVITNSHLFGYNEGLKATAKYGSKLSKVLASISSGPLLKFSKSIAKAMSGNNPVMDAMFGVAEDALSLFSRGASGGSSIDLGVDFYQGGDVTINGVSIEEWTDAQKEAAAKRKEAIEKMKQEIINSINNLESLKDLNLKDIYQSIDSGTGSSSGSNKGGTATNIFKALYEKHKHLVAMEKETQAEFFKWLDEAYKEAYKNGEITLDEYYKYEEEVHNGVNAIRDNAKKAFDDLVKYRENIIRKELEKEKKALDDKLKALREFYEKQKQMLQDQADEEQYKEEQEEKRKKISDIEQELEQLKNDNSAWAERRKAELRAELAEAEKELSDFEKQNALDEALDLLDQQLKEQESDIQKQADAIEEKLNDPNAIFNQALEEIKKNTAASLYKDMVEYNNTYGDGNEETIKDMWENIFGSLDEYYKLFGENYEGVNLGQSDNQSGSQPSTESQQEPSTSTPSQDSSTPAQEPESAMPEVGSSVVVKDTATHFSSNSGNLKMAAFVPGSTFTVYERDGNQLLIGLNGKYTGWVDKSSIVGYSRGTRGATRGIHRINEEGYEHIFETDNGNQYKMFSGGEKVLDKNSTNFLYNFATNGKELLSKIISGVNGIGGYRNNTSGMNLSTGDIIINGNADNRTVSEIRRVQREGIDYILKEFSKLSV